MRSDEVYQTLNTLNLKNLRILAREFGFSATGNRQILIYQLLNNTVQFGGAMNPAKLQDTYLSDLKTKIQANNDTVPEAYTKPDTNLIQLFIDSDPSPNKKYTEWLILGYLFDGIQRLEDLQSRALPALKDYILLSRKKLLKTGNPKQPWTNQTNLTNYLGLVGGTKKNFNYPGLEDLLKTYQEQLEAIKGTQIDREKGRSEADLVFENDLVRVLQPKTEAAACYYGQGTRWCTASNENNMFEEYASQGPIMIMIPKQPTYPGEKYQYHHQSRQYMNEKDQRVKEPIELFKRYGLETEAQKIVIDISNRDTMKRALTKYPNNPVYVLYMYKGSSSTPGGVLPEWLFKNKNTIRLVISTSRLEALPEAIGTLEKLQVLNLTDNRLKTLPESIGNLTELEELKIQENRLTALPESIGKLTNLTKLDAGVNKLKTLPESFGNLKNLTNLELNNNQLETLPESIGNLTNLTKFDAHYNQLTTLPKSIGNLVKLTHFEFPGNRLTSLPESIGNLKNLTEIDVYSNLLESLPDSIGNLINLTKLDVSGNKLKTLPESIGNLTNLNEFNASDNKLTALPESTALLKGLKTLITDGNQIKSVASLIKKLPKLTNYDFY